MASPTKTKNNSVSPSKKANKTAVSSSTMETDVDSKKENNSAADQSKNTSESNGHVNPAFSNGNLNSDSASINGAIPGKDNTNIETLDEEHPEPNRICQLICDWPKLCFGITLGLHLSMLLLTIVLIVAGVNVIPFSFGALPLFLENHPDYDRGMGWTHRNRDADIIDSSNFNRAPILERSQVNDIIQLYFDLPDGNVFSKTNLKLIEEAEDKIFNSVFQSTYCLQFGNNCAKPSSIIRYFDGTMAAVNPIFNDTDFDNIPRVLDTANTTALTKVNLQALLGIDARITSETATSSITKMTILMGGPLKGYDNLTHLKEEQKDKVKEYVLEKLKPTLDEWYNDGLGEMTDYSFNSAFISDFITNQAIMDMMLAMGSLVFIFLFLIFQTRSTWIAGFGCLSIITSFCIANLIYNLVLDFRFFGTFHILAIFIILGIGADDFFVFLDTWKLSAHREFPTLAHRLSVVYRKASAAMLFTSLTTAVAFFISATSPLLAINSFGVFSGLLVLVNYLSVITYFPCVVLVHHVCWSGPCCSCKSGARSCCGRPPLGSPNEVSAEEGVDGATPKVTKKNIIVRFFAGPYCTAITHPVGKAVSVIISLIMIAFFASQAARLTPNESESEFLPESTNIGKFLKLSSTAFKPSQEDQIVKVMVVWGIKGQDRSECHKTDPECIGNTTWDTEFNMNEAGVQTAMKDFCQKLKTGLTTEQISDLYIRRNEISNKLEIECFIDEMDSFLETEEAKAKYSGQTLTLPTSKSRIKDGLMVKNQPTIYSVSGLDASFDRWFEVGLQYWLLDGFDETKMTRSANFKAFNPMLGSSLYEYNYPVVSMPAVRYGTKLRYAAISINTSLLTRSLGYATGLPIRDTWEEFVNSQLSELPGPLKNGYMTASQTFSGSIWHWLQVQQVLVNSAVIGMAVGICVAFPILLLATCNVLVALYATIIIGCITVSVVGTIPLAGWQLGTLESLNLVLVVGLAVDYVVHLAEGYCRSPQHDRNGRVHDMLEEVGVSVLSGAITTLGSSLFLFMAVITFFKQFGAFMFATIGFSMFYSLVLFVGTLATIGPQNNFMSLKPYWNRFLAWVKAKREKK